MDVRRLDLLRELALRGSIAAVAQATHRTPSAVSQQLKVLEREAGTQLTEPAGRGIRLTSAGRRLAETATDVAIAIQKAEEVWDEFLETPSGEVSITTFPSAGEMLLPGVVTKLASTPNLKLNLTDQDPRYGDYAELTPDYDIVLADSPLTSTSWRERGVRVVTLMSEPLDVVVPAGHRLAAREFVRPADVIDETWIGAPVDYPFDRVLQAMQNETGKPANVAQRFDDNGVVEAFVAAGLGIAILPRYTTRSTHLVNIPLRSIRSQREISALVRREAFERLSVQLVMEALKSEAERISSQQK